MVRRAAWADQFYPSRPVLLRHELEKLLKADSPEKITQPIGCVSPHAAYMYSGMIAGAVYARIEIPRKCIVLCPNHTGRGSPLAIMSEGEWQMPLGNVPIDSILARELQKKCHLLFEDARAHEDEHSLEVQLPFLQKLQPKLEFVPIAVGTEAYDALELLGQAMADVIQAQRERVLIVASSDMNHFESDERTRLKDRRAIDQVLALDPRSLYDTVRHEHITMCGYCPTVAMLHAARRLGATQAELVRYGTSADVSGDSSRVVGYAGIVVW
ncbi:MAG: AmmeMemoRadiSam system protein B [Acidobacteria bacterium]|nr:AmmeMemoRadiSam system protein B [Acidobacteriota bacterium]